MPEDSLNKKGGSGVDPSHPMASKMRSHFPGLKLKRFPRRVLNMDFENDILPAEQKLID